MDLTFLFFADPRRKCHRDALIYAYDVIVRDKKPTVVFSKDAQR